MLGGAKMNKIIFVLMMVILLLMGCVFSVHGLTAFEIDMELMGIQAQLQKDAEILDNINHKDYGAALDRLDKAIKRAMELTNLKEDVSPDKKREAIAVFRALQSQLETQRSLYNLHMSMKGLNDTFSKIDEGKKLQQSDKENREALVLRLRYMMELTSRITDEQYTFAIQELGGTPKVNRLAYIAALPMLEWATMNNFTETAAEMSVFYEEYISAIERLLGINR
jgi:hypothetical protein